MQLRGSLGNRGLGAAHKQYSAGTHRLLSPDETCARVEPFMPVAGITRIANVTGLDVIGIPVVMVCRPNSRSVAVSQGKGVTMAAARASGLMESLESFHAERITLPLKLASYDDLRFSHELIDVMGLPRLASSRFTAHTPMLWIEGNDILGNRDVWVPYELVHLNYTTPLPPGHGCFIASSNGLASGNHPLEAISHGINEVVERDAATLWHLIGEEAQDRTRIDLDTVDDPMCRDLMDRYRAAGVRVAVWETTSDIGIPAFLCRILQDGAPPFHTYRPASGMGCHPCREVALLRALTEAAQSRLTFISGARDDMLRQEYDKFLDARTYKAWERRLERGGLQKSFRDVPTWHGETLEDDLDWQLDRLRAVGLREVVVVDLTKPEFGIPVVRVVVPGLEGLDHSPEYILGPRAQALLKVAA